jgi:AP-1 complex subunit beta-1
MHPCQVALKTGQLGVFYWDDAIPLPAVLEEGGTIDGSAFLSAWRGLAQESAQRLDVTIGDIEAAKAKLAAARLFVLAHRPVGAGQAVVCLGGESCLVRASWHLGSSAALLT